MFTAALESDFFDRTSAAGYWNIFQKALNKPEELYVHRKRRMADEYVTANTLKTEEGKVCIYEGEGALQHRLIRGPLGLRVYHSYLSLSDLAHVNIPKGWHNAVPMLIIYSSRLDKPSSFALHEKLHVFSDVYRRLLEYGGNNQSEAVIKLIGENINRLVADYPSNNTNITFTHGWYEGKRFCRSTDASLHIVERATEHVPPELGVESVHINFASKYDPGLNLVHDFTEGSEEVRAMLVRLFSGFSDTAGF